MPSGLESLAFTSPVILAPMSGVTDAPFRRLAHGLGAGGVVSEMVASEEFARQSPRALRKADDAGVSPFVIQLVGCEAKWMAEGARRAEALGADVIDMNMGCPAREVTGKQSGSALMRDLDHAASLMEAVIGATNKPVTLKMRLGWDERSIVAPELARRAEAAGVAMLTVHARTRAQFFNGAADWSRVRAVCEAVTIPVLVNGDVVCAASAREAVDRSGASGVMIGRGAYGAPWRLKQIADALRTGRDPGPPPLTEQARIAVSHITDMLSHYGSALGLRNARKHVGWYLESSGVAASVAKAWRTFLCREDEPDKVLRGLGDFYDQAAGAAA